MKFPYSRPNVTKTDLSAVKKSLKGQFLTGGPIIKKYEEQLAHQFNAKHAIVCNSGTAALHLIYMALGLTNGDKILTSPITFVATANAALMCGAKVVFADVDPRTGMLTPETVEKELKNTRREIKIITIVHMGGRLCDLEGIYKVAKKYNVFLIEDACHAPGAVYYNKNKVGFQTGSCKYTIASSFSFHAIKNITMAEGGCITTNSKKIADKVRLKLDHGLIRNNSRKKEKLFLDPWYYKAEELGYNYRASEINCALGLSQLKRLKKSIKERNSLARIYKVQLEGTPAISFPENAFKLHSNVWHLFTILVDFNLLNLNKRKFFNLLKKAGVGTQVHYIPLFFQPIYNVKNKQKFSGAINYYSKNLSLPMYIGLRKEDIIYICNTIKNIIFLAKKK